jgi:hypothetical protein
MRASVLIGLLLTVGCAPAIPPASETLPRLRRAIEEPVANEQQNRDNSALVEQISEAQQLDGMTRDEVSAQLGRGDKCSRHPICGEQGFEAEDWYYEVGSVGPAYMRARPVLIVGFDRFNQVVRTYNVRLE